MNVTLFLQAKTPSPAKTPMTATTTITCPAPTPIHFPTDVKPLLLSRCRTKRDIHQLHAHLLKTGFHLRLSLAEALLESAALHVPTAFPHAVKMFDKMPRRNTAVYNIMIRGFNSHNSPDSSISLFKAMLEDSVEVALAPAAANDDDDRVEMQFPVVPDKYTFSCALKACSRVGAVREGEQIHAHVLKSRCLSNGFVENTLIHMYASCGCADVARKVFDGLSERSSVTWNAMLSGYSRADNYGQVIELFQEMVDSDIPFDEVAAIMILTACGRLGDLNLGEWVDGYLEERGLKGRKNMNLMTALVDMYAKCGKIEKARYLFDEMPVRDVVTWSAMISGYNQSSRCKEALDLFHEMQLSGVEPNEVTMVSVLASCAVLGALETGRWVHSFISRKHLALTITLGTVLVDFYAKCGSIETSIETFNNMPRKNVLTWTILIQGMASNGKGRLALTYFNLMINSGVRPNDVTFIAVLTACSHTGLVEEGKKLFESMANDYGIAPRIDHYGCMVDILSRAGMLRQAYQFIRSMPIQPNAVIWRTLLGSCKLHKNVEIGEEALSQIVNLDPAPHSGDYVLLSSIYALVGRFEDALRVRVEMKDKGIKKSPGCTLIEIGGSIHEFFAEDTGHPESNEIYVKVEEVIRRIKLAGYVPKMEDARFDVEEDEKEASVSHHSEKLAIAYGLMKARRGDVIRISKNLRVCTDCHAASKLISKVFEREIVVRDRNRFHHFKNGNCSCNDYW